MLFHSYSPVAANYRIAYFAAMGIACFGLLKNRIKSSVALYVTCLVLCFCPLILSASYVKYRLSKSGRSTIGTIYHTATVKKALGTFFYASYKFRVNGQLYWKQEQTNILLDTGKQVMVYYLHEDPEMSSMMRKTNH